MKEKPFPVTIAGKNFELTRQNTDVYLHRPLKYQDLDYLRVFDFDTEVVTNIFRLPEMARILAGLAFKENGFPYVVAFPDRETFKDKYGWFADSYVRDEPSEATIEGYSLVEADHDIGPDGMWDFDGEV